MAADMPWGLRHLRCIHLRNLFSGHQLDDGIRYSTQDKVKIVLSCITHDDGKRILFSSRDQPRGLNMIWSAIDPSTDYFAPSDSGIGHTGSATAQVTLELDADDSTDLIWEWNNEQMCTPYWTHLTDSNIVSPETLAAADLPHNTLVLGFSRYGSDLMSFWIKNDTDKSPAITIEGQSELLALSPREESLGMSLSTSSAVKVRSETLGDLVQFSSIAECTSDTVRSLNAIRARLDNYTESSQNSKLRDDAFQAVRLDLLRKEVARLKEETARRKQRSLKRKKALEQREAALELSRQALQNSLDELSEVELQKSVIEDSLEILNAQISSAKARSFKRVATLFPISSAPGSSSNWMICAHKLHIPPSLLPKHSLASGTRQLPQRTALLSASDENSNNAAWSFLILLLQELSNILALPLPYAVRYNGSQSSIRDDVSVMTGQRWFPVGFSGSQRLRAEYGAFLLSKNIEHIMAREKLAAQDFNHLLPNVRTILLAYSSNLTDENTNGNRNDTPTMTNATLVDDLKRTLNSTPKRDIGRSRVRSDFASPVTDVSQSIRKLFAAGSRESEQNNNRAEIPERNRSKNSGSRSDSVEDNRERQHQQNIRSRQSTISVRTVKQDDYSSASNNRHPWHENRVTDSPETVVGADAGGEGKKEQPINSSTAGWGMRLLGIG